MSYSDGRIVFDRARSRFSPSALFAERLGTTLTAAQAEEEVFAALLTVTKTLQKPYRFALTDAERKLDDDGKLGNDVVPAIVRAFSGRWPDYLAVFNAWAGDSRPHLEEIINNDAATDSSGLLAPLTTAHVPTALLVYEDGSYDAESGTVAFSVIDPVSDWADTAQAEVSLPGVEAGKQAARVRQLTDFLNKRLARRPRSADAVEKTLQRFYADRGLKPSVQIDNRAASPLRLTVIEAPRVVSISWPSLDAGDKNVDKILSSLLTDRAYRASLRGTKALGPDCTKTAIRAAKTFEYQKCTGRPGPYLNPSVLQVQQLLLNELGYTVGVLTAVNDPTSSNVTFVVQKTEGVVKDDKETPEAAPALANKEGVVESHEQQEEQKTEFTPEEKKKGEKIEDKKRYVGGGLEYRPGQGVRFFGLGQMSRLPMPAGGVSNVSVQAGGQGTGGALGSVNYFADYLFFNTLHRRLSVQLTSASDLDPARSLAGTPGAADERRRGGLARAELEMFRDLGGSLLRFYAEGRRDTVAVRPTLRPGEARQNLSTLDVGALYVFDSKEVESPRHARLEPRLRLGLGLAGGEPRFNKLVTVGSLHQKLPERFELDFSGRVELAGRRTPVFELPSFGGADVVRGFRRDDALGRKLWSLQNEVWVPLPFDGEGLKALLRQSVKLAPFVDVGGVYDTVGAPPGVRWGAGLGLRFIQSPVVFKLDYAYGFGAAATGGSRGKFHFGVVTNLPF
jgi:hypothetical protein